jgi:hypothetical protein
MARLLEQARRPLKLLSNFYFFVLLLFPFVRAFEFTLLTFILKQLST